MPDLATPPTQDHLPAGIAPGGTNGEADREALWGEACNTLGVPQ